ncbi:helix-turn-helix domain-containing protein [Heyndrickxia oleronia]|jgi:transcriptional regulator with XRE-family HTH domain|uniref:helix-turn-helix domain-containing protein n=1 Tax=Heyndrickxia oleronia TaxID=38875 RepID=UPI00242C2256|nr:XRE family transcriptional regulator [Heyndrickxia oleronia]MCI1591019.1 XRE family transcriptional regulator [Heyndrickxia oleronia]MCI1613078.1 XRE family transcriptional regulator [Heyndrickxia oleronia]MCI1761032.1 XRE family transcriptional regulator [Heyndrickxia oleronia]
MVDIHTKIRELRQQQGLTLKELSENTNLSVGFLSQVERGTSSLAITSLKKIADSLGVEMSYFFQQEMNNNYVVKLDDHRVFQVDGNESKYVKVSGNFQGRSMESLIVTLRPFQQDIQTSSHPGEEFHYVLKGQVIIHVDNNEYVLNAGESIHFPSEKVHKWENPLSEETVILSVLTPVLF